MNKYLPILFLCFSIVAYGQAPYFEWAKLQGGVFPDKCNSVTTDQEGNVYTVGTFAGAVNFNLGLNPVYLSSTGGSDIYITKRDHNGQLLWAVRIGNSWDEDATSIATDETGNVYITGIFKGDLDFDPGPDPFWVSSYGNSIDAFVLKLNTDGSFLWVKNMGGINTDQASSLTVDDAGNVYVTGVFKDMAYFEVGVDPVTVYANGEQDVFISKLNTEGDLLWAKSVGGEFNEDGGSIVVDNSNNVYTTGTFIKHADFDPGMAAFNLGAEGNKPQVFLLRLDAEGHFGWVKKIGNNTYGTTGSGLAIDQEDELYMVGSFRDPVDFDPGPDTVYLNSSNFHDSYILKLDNNGNYLWAKTLDSPYLNAITIDKNNKVYTGGIYNGTLDFDPGPDVYELPTSSSQDAFILQLNENGSFLWAGSIGGYNNQIISSISIDDSYNIYTCGDAKGSPDFAPEAGGYSISTIGNSDGFIQKLRQQHCAPNQVIHSSSNIFSTCPGQAITLYTEIPFGAENLSYVWNTGDSTSAVILNPDVNTIYSVAMNYTIDGIACNSFNSATVSLFDSVVVTISDDMELCQFDPINLFASGGTYYDWSQGGASSTTTFLATETQTYTVTVTDANGCTGQASVEVTVNLMPDITYISSSTCDPLLGGTIEYVYPAFNGCDSIVSITNSDDYALGHIQLSPVIWVEENEPPFQLFFTDIANADYYVWTLPEGASILSGEGTNNVTIDLGTLSNGGDICVTAVNDSCSSPTACIVVNVTMPSSIDQVADTNYSVFPNPTSATVKVLFPNTTNGTYQLRDLDGKLLLDDLLTTTTEIDLSRQAPGVYILLLKTKDGFWVERLLKI